MKVIELDKARREKRLNNLIKRGETDQESSRQNNDITNYHNQINKLNSKLSALNRKKD